MRNILLAFLLTLPASGQDSGELLWHSNHDGATVCAIYRKADGNLTVNIPDKYIYQFHKYWVTLYHSGQAMQVTKYDIAPSLEEGQQATHAGLRDSRRFERPMRWERSFASVSGDAVHVYTGGGSIRLILYRMAR